MTGNTSAVPRLRKSCQVSILEIIDYFLETLARAAFRMGHFCWCIKSIA